MDPQVETWLRVSFWVLSAGVVVLPMRWALISLLLLAHLDLSGASFASASEIGVENAIKVAGLPLVLLLRMRLGPLRNARLSWAAAAWAGLMIYSAVATLWSPFQISALKMVAYLWSYSLLFLVFSHAWLKGWLSVRIILAIAWCSLAMAAWQTYYLQSPFLVEKGRLSTFASPQSYAAYLICVLAIVSLSFKSGIGFRLSSAVIVFATFLTGSRYALMGLASLLTILWFVRTITGKNAQQKAFALVKGVAGAAAVILLFMAVLEYSPDNRFSEMLRPNPYGGSVLQNVGTLVWRLGIYQGATDSIVSGGVGRLVFGAGTSSGAGFLLEYDRRYRAHSIDANRALHNEFLRALYEWGLIGFTLLAAFLIFLLAQVVKRVARDRSRYALALLAVCPTLVISLTVENVLAGPGGPGGVGFALVLSCGLGRRRLAGQRVPTGEVAPPAEFSWAESQAWAASRAAFGGRQIRAHGGIE
jgi:O-antigen ligase